ncbi:MAG: metallophosphoesterase [archaeon]
MNSIVNFFLDNGILLNETFLQRVKEENLNSFLNLLNDKLKKKPVFLNEDLFYVVKNVDKEFDLNWSEFNKSLVLLEKGRDDSLYNAFLDMMEYNLDENKRKALSNLLGEIKNDEVDFDVESDVSNNVIILKSYIEEIKKREVQDFVIYFRKRYEALRNILINRTELQDSISINRILNKSGKENVSLIGIVNNKTVTKNGNIIFELEDFSGSIKVIFSSSKKELSVLAKDIVLDEVIGISGINLGDAVFANNLFFPDIPLTNELKKLDKEEYVVFTGDLHFGSKMFLQDDFLNFIDWLNLKYGDKEQKRIASKVRYVFFVGDLVEGVGIYPGQEEDLLIKDIYKQYEGLALLLSKIRKDIKVVLIGGNHDALRIAEPQPMLDKKLAKPIYELQNVIIGTNPSIINIASSSNFIGFNVLLYHGFSFPYLAENIDSVRINGRLDRADLIMKSILQKRHLAPSHESSLYIPDTKGDSLVIDKVPDFFVSGHIHKTSVLNYRGVTTLGCGCWTKQTGDQAKRGIVPEPSKVIITNLQTRDVKILNFSKNE